LKIVRLRFILGQGGIEMKTSKALLVAGMAVFMVAAGVGGCAKPLIHPKPKQYTGIGEAQKPGLKSKGPVMTHAYAIDRGSYGTSLKIYLEAEDPNGEMDKIETQIHQTGHGYYFPDFIVLKPQYKKSFRGFIQWNTYSSKTPGLEEWTRLTVRVSVISKKGLASNVFEFPFTFESGTGKAPPPPAPFDQGDLPKIGSVTIELIDPVRIDTTE
jgi:hypothetical protein